MTISFSIIAAICIICAMWNARGEANNKERERSFFWVVAGIVFIILAGATYSPIP